MDIATAEAEARAFAELFPTPNVLKAVAYAESGRLSWFQIHELFNRSLQTGLKEVRV